MPAFSLWNEARVIPFQRADLTDLLFLLFFFYSCGSVDNWSQNEQGMVKHILQSVFCSFQILGQRFILLNGRDTPSVEWCQGFVCVCVSVCVYPELCAVHISVLQRMWQNGSLISQEPAFLKDKNLTFIKSLNPKLLLSDVLMQKLLRYSTSDRWKMLKSTVVWNCILKLDHNFDPVSLCTFLLYNLSLVS